jgi:hypothetical protein
MIIHANCAYCRRSGGVAGDVKVTPLLALFLSQAAAAVKAARDGDERTFQLMMEGCIASMEHLKSNPAEAAAYERLARALNHLSGAHDSDAVTPSQALAPKLGGGHVH